MTFTEWLTLNRYIFTVEEGAITVEGTMTVLQDTPKLPRNLTVQGSLYYHRGKQFLPEKLKVKNLLHLLGYKGPIPPSTIAGHVCLSDSSGITTPTASSERGTVLRMGGSLAIVKGDREVMPLQAYRRELRECLLTLEEMEEELLKKESKAIGITTEGRRVEFPVVEG